MAWFKVDDKLHSHVKAARAGVEAMGLWLLCGSWCMDQLTDGFVPDYIALRIDPKARAKAARLVSAGLWFEAVQDGDKGWKYHDWLNMQRSKEQVNAERSASAERQQRAREAAKKRREGNESEPDKGERAIVTPLSRRESRRDKGVSHGPPDQTRPDQTNKEEQTPTESGPRKRGTRLPEGWQPDESLIAQMRSECPSVDLRKEHAVFVDYWCAQPGQRGVKLDWPATWRNWMRRATGQARGTDRPEPPTYPNVRDLPPPIDAQPEQWLIDAIAETDPAKADRLRKAADR